MKDNELHHIWEAYLSEDHGDMEEDKDDELARKAQKVKWPKGVKVKKTDKKYDPKKSHESQYEGDPEVERLAKPTSDELKESSAQDMNAHRQVVEALRAAAAGFRSALSLKETDIEAGTIVVSTGGEKSIILKVVGYEGGHDIPVSQRPDSSDIGPYERERLSPRHGGVPRSP